MALTAPLSVSLQSSAGIMSASWPPPRQSPLRDAASCQVQSGRVRPCHAPVSRPARAQSALRSGCGPRSNGLSSAVTLRSGGTRLHSKPLCSRISVARSDRRSGLTVQAASEESAKEVYNGVYGPWSVEDADVLEVLAYRAGLVTAAGSFLLAASTAFLPEGTPLQAPLASSRDALYALGTAGLGTALVLIHIYVTPIKRALQLLWAVGVLGSLALGANFAGPAGKGLVEFVVEQPAGVWAVGPLFAALTGLVFKEGLCYGKLEAAALFFLIPSLLLGHLSGAMDVGVEKGLLAAWMALFALFAARKFLQPIKDDIGDKSVFIFQALPPDQQQALIAKLQGPPGPDAMS